MSKKTLIIVLGPTGVGKTAVGIELAKYFDTEIISSDSRQLFKELKTGTAVPSDEELAAVKHHLIHTISIHDYYNVSRFESDATEILENLFQTKDKVIMAGGSGLYIDAVCYGIDELPSADHSLREQLKNQLQEEGIEKMRLQLKEADPEYYGRADLNNPKRILKALEISIITGKPYSSLLTNKPKQRDFAFLKIGLNMDRRKLYENIDKRVDWMIANGLVEEARKFYPYRHLNALNTVGYKEIYQFLDQKTDLGEAVRLIKRNTRHYARRQLTWFRRYNDIEWFDPGDTEEMIRFIEHSV